MIQRPGVRSRTSSNRRDAVLSCRLIFVVDARVTSNLVWMDLEMTGLDPERDVILEMATIVTDGNLNVIAEGRRSQSRNLKRNWPRWTNGIRRTTRRRVWCSACEPKGSVPSRQKR